VSADDRPIEPIVSRYSSTTVDHFQHPRNVGRMHTPSAVGTLDDADSETTIEIYLAVANGRVERASFRALGCSACIAASSIVTVLLVGRPAREAAAPPVDEIVQALGGLPDDKTYCAALVALAAGRAMAHAEKVSAAPLAGAATPMQSG
jgi:NifU-like protein involved in Fe-S cluster formation